jgi:hypothetical protein
MDILSYSNVIPWFIDPAYLMKMVEISFSVVALLIIAGLGYSGLFHLLSNRTRYYSIRSGRTKFGWSDMENITYREGQYDEA